MSDDSNQKNDPGFMNIDRRVLLGGGALLGAAAMVGGPKLAFAQDKSPKDYRFGISIPFSGLDAYQNLIAGYEAAMEQLGGEVTIVEANYDVKKQADQIATLVSSGVDALIVLPTDPAGVSNAVQAAVAAGMPTFCTNAYVPGATVVSTSIHDGFGMGETSARYLAERLGGKGKIGIITLPLNEGWATRTMGMEFALRDYPDIEVVAEWPFDATLKVTARDAVDNMLTAHPDLSAIWASWDGAAIEATLAMRAAGRDDMFVTGIDGGRQAFEYIKAGTQFVFTVAQSFFQESYYSVYFAHQYLGGRPAPRFVINSAYAVTQESLENLSVEEAAMYGRFGKAREFGWQRVA
ncbi:MAG: sugar ABC transporter substrate-binding protein [Rhodospirillales bacterium]